jgi:hypothetical protein
MLYPQREILVTVVN